MYLPAAFTYAGLAGARYRDTVQTYAPSPHVDHHFEHASGAHVMKYPLGTAMQSAPFFAVTLTVVAVGIGTNYLEYSSIGGGHAHLNFFCT